MKTLKIYTDGGSRNNPGESAIAGIIFCDGKEVKSFSETIGIATNSEAEYRALIKGLILAKEFAPAEVTCYSDSEFMIRQMRSEYKVKAPNIRTLFNKAITAESNFPKVHYIHLPRTAKEIRECDLLVNQVLDAAEIPGVDLCRSAQMVNLD